MTPFKTERKRLTRYSQVALFLSLTLVFSLLEALLPPPPIPFPVRYGLSNIPLMVAFFFVGPAPAFAIVLFKAFVALLMRGALAGGLSLSGGLVSFVLLYIFIQLNKRRSSLLLLSVSSSLGHLFGQFALLSLLFKGLSFKAFVAFLSPLLFFGLITGVLSGLAMALLLPALEATGLISEPQNSPKPPSQPPLPPHRAPEDQRPEG